MNSAEVFDRDYYENGLLSGKSWYDNYRWMPEKVFPAAAYIKGLCPHGKVLDFGCAKGFLVHALRLLGLDAFGYDTSEYAIENAHPATKPFLSTGFQAGPFDLVFAKDVFEHIEKPVLAITLCSIRSICSAALFVVPLGDNGRYRIPEYHCDRSHLVAEDEEWWINKFVSAGFSIKDFAYKAPGIKDNWTEKHPYGNAILRLG